MLLAIVFSSYQAIDVGWTCDPAKIHEYTLSAGLYSVEIQGAEGGDACSDGVKSANGGRGSNIQALLQIKGEYTVEFVIGEKPPLNCSGRINRGGWPDGGSSGYDDETLTTPDVSGGGGGSTELRIKDQEISLLIAGGGGGAADYHVGGFGGGIGTNGGFDILDTCENWYFPEEHEGLSTDKHEEGRQGGRGQDHPRVTGAGGGGGKYGGIGGTYSKQYYFCSAGFGGSSYFNDTRGEHSWFMQTPIVLNGSRTEATTNGSGCYQIHTQYKCPDNCFYCLDSDTCKECNYNAKSYKGKCYLSCNDTYSEIHEGTYLMHNGRQCAKCHSSCETCSGQSSDQCTSCPDGMVLYQGYCKPPSTPVYTPVITPITTPVMTFHETPFETMYETPFLTMHETAFETPYLTNHETPFNTVFETPFTTNHETPYETPFTTMFNTPYLTEFETPFVTNHETPFETQFITAFETPYLTNFETPFVTAFETPFSTNEVTAFETPFMSMFETPFSTAFETAASTHHTTAFETNHKTPFISMFETPYNTAFQTAFETAFETPFITAKETEEIQDIPIPIPEPEKSSSSVSSSDYNESSSSSLSQDLSSSQSSSSSNIKSSGNLGQDDADAINKEKIKKKKTIVYSIIGAILALIIIITIIVLSIYFYSRKSDEKESTVEEEMIEETVISSTGETAGVTIDNPLWTTTVVDDSEDIFRHDFEEQSMTINIFEA